MADIFKKVFTKVRIIDESCKIPEHSYDVTRKQYSAPLFLHAIRNYADENKYDKILGITPLDLYVSRLNFVFGMAEFGSHAKAAVISLFRLYPEFYGLPANKTVFLLRVVKEGLHEIGHTFGLEHCNNVCIMVFSNNIDDTDKKSAAFCEECLKKLPLSS